MFLAAITGFVYFKYIKPNTFKFGRIIPFLIMFSIIIFLDVRHRINNTRFFNSSFHSKIVDCKDYGKIANANYILENDLFIPSNVGDFDIIIGDSITKNSQTYEYNVYRKNEYGRYSYVHRYKYLP